MAWAVAHTWVSGAVLTAAQLNTHLSQNMNETAAGKAAAAGDVFYASGVNAVAALSAGTDGSVLVYDTTNNAPAWQPDMTLHVCQHGTNATTSGALSKADYVQHVSDTFTLPDGWVSAELSGWGSVGVSQSDDNQTLQVRVTIGSSNGTAVDGGELSINHDMAISASHKATVTETTVVSVDSIVVGDNIGSLTFANAAVAWYAIRKS